MQYIKLISMCWLRHSNTVLITYLHHRVATRKRLHCPATALRLIVRPVMGLWLHFNL